MQPLAYAVLVAALAANLGAQDWTLQNPANAPTPRALASLTAEPGGSVLLFGGFMLSAPFYMDGTWRWNGSTWNQLTTTNSPSPRAGARLVSNHLATTAVLYGGSRSGAVGDTWTWDGVDWTLADAGLAPGTSSPNVVLGGAMAYDLLRGKVVLFGGVDRSGSGGIYQDQTWEFDVTTSTWSRVLTPTVPQARSEAQMAYDLLRGECVMFGGKFNPGAVRQNETWVYNGVDWVQRFPANVPCANSGENNIAYDLQRGVVVFHAPKRGTCPNTDETWEWDGQDWHRVFTSQLPSGDGQTASLAWDNANQQVMRFGGTQSGASLNATWLYGGQHPYFATFGVGCAGSNGTPVLTPQTLPALGSSLQVEATSLPATGALTAMAVGFGKPATPIDLTSYGHAGCRVFVQADAALFLPNANGMASYVLQVPSDPAFAGVEVFLQLAALQSGGSVALSNAGLARIW